ncbi:hypothetical protein [Candidatus Hydrogenosomobacter endosymbioticus]|uniref:Uncharacterized protein n=1 Tax=Candidatus Hydrogenosomobacter endosymbioticus TaxID=2558174 RepID=A0ABM7V9W9_9PROT|nr:hypothetical protein [Candidatus Hydrogenosomobacter endosymbioticus]BDB96570.1 hypothetical protein HYD_7030 [Candidatus Hydrogenosomobacter endosymbioticus]
MRRKKNGAKENKKSYPEKDSKKEKAKNQTKETTLSVQSSSNELLEKLIVSVDIGFNKLGNKMDAGFKKVNAKLDAMNTKIDDLGVNMNKRFDEFNVNRNKPPKSELSDSEILLEAEVKAGPDLSFLLEMCRQFKMAQRFHLIKQG